MNRGTGADVSAALAAAVVLTGVQGITPALPVLRAQLGLSEFEVSLLIVGYLLSGALCAFPAGIIADRVGLRRTVVAALVVFGCCGIAAFFWYEFVPLLVIRLVQGAICAVRAVPFERAVGHVCVAGREVVLWPLLRT